MLQRGGQRMRVDRCLMRQHLRVHADREVARPSDLVWLERSRAPCPGRAMRVCSARRGRGHGATPTSLL